MFRIQPKTLWHCVNQIFRLSRYTFIWFRTRWTCSVTIIISRHFDILWCHCKFAACANHGRSFYTKLHILLFELSHLNIPDATTNQDNDTPDSLVFHSVYIHNSRMSTHKSLSFTHSKVDRSFSSPSCWFWVHVADAMVWGNLHTMTNHLRILSDKTPLLWNPC